MSSRRDQRVAACAAGPAQVPGCDTGPAGRVAFVAHELASLWRQLIGHVRPTPDPDPDKDTQ